MRLRILASTFLVLILVAAGLIAAGGSASAATAAPPDPPEGSYSEVKGFEPKAGGDQVTPLLGNPCGGFVVVRRFTECVFVPSAHIIFISQAGEGDITIQMLRRITLNPRSRQFSEDITMEVLNVSGLAVGTTLTSFTATCGGSCRATAELPQGVALRTGLRLTGTVQYTDTTATQHTTHTNYTLSFFNPIPVTPIRLESADYRCDNQVGLLAGCVFPGFTPTMTSMANLPNISQNIADIQAAGPNHYGNQVLSDGENPLHRTTSRTIQRQNRAAACGGRFNPFPLLQSCDEYPFARTLEGASRTTFPDWGWRFVPTLEQGAQAGFISSFVQDQRILNGDAYWVQP